jgi:hypothetical protein
MNTKAQKRVAIAQDVIEHLDALDPRQNYAYVHTCYTPTTDTEEDGAQQHINKISKDCQVCALGACFLSYIRLFNKVKLCQITHAGHVFCARTQIYDQLQEFFATSQLGEIEKAFEFNNKNFDPSETPKDRLKAIMQNIVDNNGTFKT